MAVTAGGGGRCREGGGGVRVGCPLDLAVLEDAGIEPRTVETLVFLVRRSNLSAGAKSVKKCCL
jgi:hypothetical protein